MVKRAVKADIKADYLLVDSWYSKPVFVKSIKDFGLNIISRITNSPTTWQFSKRDNNKQKTLTGIYRILSKSIPTYHLFNILYILLNIYEILTCIT